MTNVINAELVTEMDAVNRIINSYYAFEEGLLKNTDSFYDTDQRVKATRFVTETCTFQTKKFLIETDPLFPDFVKAVNVYITPRADKSFSVEWSYPTNYPTSERSSILYSAAGRMSWTAGEWNPYRREDASVGGLTAAMIFNIMNKIDATADEVTHAPTGIKFSKVLDDSAPIGSLGYTVTFPNIQGKDAKYKEFIFQRSETSNAYETYLEDGLSYNLVYTRIKAVYDALQSGGGMDL